MSVLNIRPSFLESELLQSHYSLIRRQINLTQILICTHLQYQNEKAFCVARRITRLDSGMDDSVQSCWRVEYKQALSFLAGVQVVPSEFKHHTLSLHVVNY